jgi:putative lipoic acid-binding regulatory protein
MTDMNEMDLPELNFPCEYPIKVIGRDEENFVEFVFEILSHHIPELLMEAFTTSRSSGGKYVSVSVTIIAESRAQVTSLYEELGRHPRVRVAM